MSSPQMTRMFGWRCGPAAGRAGAAGWAVLRVAAPVLSGHRRRRRRR
jgi:hypothetical protein